MNNLLDSFGSSISNALAVLRGGSKADELDLSLSKVENQKSKIEPSWADMMDDSDCSDLDWDSPSPRMKLEVVQSNAPCNKPCVVICPVKKEEIIQHSTTQCRESPQHSTRTATPTPPKTAPASLEKKDLPKRTWAQVVRPASCVKPETAPQEVACLQPKEREEMVGDSCKNSGARKVSVSYASALKCGIPTAVVQSTEVKEELETQPAAIGCLKEEVKVPKKSFLDSTLSWADKLMGRPRREESSKQELQVDAPEQTQVEESLCSHPTPPVELPSDVEPCPSVLPVVQAGWTWAEKVRGHKQVAEVPAPTPCVQFCEEEPQPFKQETTGCQAACMPKALRNGSDVGGVDGWTSIHKLHPREKRPAAHHHCSKKPVCADNRSRSHQTRSPPNHATKELQDSRRLVTPSKSLDCLQRLVTPTSGSWASKVKAPYQDPEAVTKEDVPEVHQPSAEEEECCAKQQPQVSVQMEEAVAPMPAVSVIPCEAPATQPLSVQRDTPVRTPNPWRRPWLREAVSETRDTTEAVSSPSSVEQSSPGYTPSVPTKDHSSKPCWADRVRGFNTPVQGQSLAEKARNAKQITFQGHQFPQPGWTPSPYISAAKRAQTPTDSKCCDSPMQDPSMKLHFSDVAGDVVLLEPYEAALWVGSLKIRVNNDKWLCEHFAPYSLVRVLERGDGFAILLFPRTIVSRVMEVFEGYRVDGRKMVVRPSKKYVPAPELSVQ